MRWPEVLSDHLKSGQPLSLQNRPTEGARNFRCSTLSIPVQASLICNGSWSLVLCAPLSLSGGVCGAAGGGAGFDGGGVCCAADIQGNTSASTKAINCSLTNARTLCFSWAELPSDAIRSHGCRCSTWVAISGQNSRNTFVSASRPSAHPNFVARAPAVRLPLG